jgi:uncharacterized secreted protein with C-terminal beta-propeller domain
MVGGLLGGVLWNYGGVYVPKIDSLSNFGFMQQFKDYEELTKFIENRTYYYSAEGFWRRGFGIVAESLSQSAPASDEFNAKIDYSSTNIQVEGVDEGDVVKTDGIYIYLAKGTNVYIIKSYPPEEAKIITTINQSINVNTLYVSGDKLVVFGVPSPNILYDLVNPDYIVDKGKTRVMVYDISDRSNPLVERELTFDGLYFSSRLIDEYLYFIIKNPVYHDKENIVLPTIRDGKEWTSLQATDVWYCNNTEGWLEYNIIASLNIQDPESPIRSETFLLDASTVLYVSQQNLFIVGLGWDEGSTVTKIGIGDGNITFKANATVPGYVLNQFSMDEYNGYFRIATTLDTWRSSNAGNNVYVLDEELNLLGSLEGLAPGEQIYSARFMGERCYLVTFKKVDPLFTIDLSDPQNPVVLGKLKIPGFSSYLHPYDNDILIGIGKETKESEYGDFAWHQGIKISLFDVSDVENPRELAKIEVGDRGSDSPVLYDHHAFLFSREKNLLVIPILEAQIDETDFSGEVPPDFYGNFINQGAYIFDVSEEGIVLNGRVTHIEDDILLKSGYWFSSEFEVKRSLYIDNNLYTISSGMIKINNLYTLDEIALVRLGE